MGKGFLAELGRSATAIGIALYGLGWIFVASLFARMDLTPADVGFDFVFLVSRLGSVAFVAASLLVIPFHATNAWNWREQAKKGNLFWFNIVIATTHVGFGACIFLSAGIKLGLFSPLFTTSVDGKKLALAVLLGAGASIAALLLAATTLNALGYSARRNIGPSIRYNPGRSEKSVVIASFSLALLAFSSVVGAAAGDRLLRGDGLDLIVFSFPRAEVTSSDEKVRYSGCDTLLLGFKDGRTVLLHSETGQPPSVIRISRQDVLVITGSSVSSMCSNPKTGEQPHAD